MIRFLSRIGQAGTYVLSLQIRIIRENLRVANPGCQQIEDILNADAHAANARASAALLWIECDPVHRMKLRILWGAVKVGLLRLWLHARSVAA